METQALPSKTPLSKTMQTVIHRDRIIIGIGIALMAMLGWGYLMQMSVAPGQAMAMPSHASGNWQTVGLNAVMWAVMMIAMMLPTASPMIMSFTRVLHQQQAESAMLSTGVFIAGYLAVWFGFSAIAAMSQVGLHNSDLLSSPMGKTGPELGAGLLITAGAFHWSPLKEACLDKCRSPLSFLLLEWRKGKRGAFIMGLRHGVFCMGCCWALMLLMFAGGVMNLAWMALLAVYMLLEKVVPNGRLFSRVSGIMLMMAGGGILLGS